MHYKRYWATWAVLLLLTVLMIFIGNGPLPKLLLLGVLLVAMMVKAVLIGAQFMHLSSEHRGIVFMVAAGLLLVGLALFAGIAPDGVRAFELRQ
ncbi:MAG: cytochrome C oxidase subunit IV family protein [Acidobacteriia bacterium]|nr:cytochrome C oxidase subunit IV family protein [Terriglobia bacterium]